MQTHHDVAASSPRPAPRRAAQDLYLAIWRWHFYAGLLVLPFLVTLAVTGALYLFNDELDAWWHADLKRVSVQEQAPLPPSTLLAAALEAQPGTPLKYTAPATPDASAEITIADPQGEPIAVYLDPYRGEVLGWLPDRGTLMWTVRHLHSLRLFGPIARGLIEIAAGWSILLVGTGLYLWWPRRSGSSRLGGVLSVRGTPRRRLFWRDTHAVSGVLVGAFIVFLAVTGMPWSNLWGGKVNEWANGNNFGYPAGLRVAVPLSDEHLDHLGPTTWSLERAQVPLSSHDRHDAAPIDLDQAVATFERLGLHPGYAVNLPSTPDGVFTGSVYPDDVAQQRVVHLDQYSGEPLLDMRYADYGPLGRWLEWGINVHLGQQFGRTNQIVLLIACLAMVLLAVSAAIMWWKRRPSGKLGTPPLPKDPKILRGVVAILALGGVIFPLVGASLLAMLVLDRLWVWQRQRRL
ncbi:Uncharacterized iron-regulated membrane protein [Franzmannia pantelleriensis]|uniref:Uncharacterized iron-regulated membrane protein n=1 Tax=Franzmannia pantelleriensis TaxID=48727 RepID=A0A1G9N759_9GAMM|nr:PepSY domain-containing protein [Halomonas pantelleriensis]SDL82330.1 Uncharacterized iron-regulated membrane protein [Halomonas pantelleriensis]